MQGKQIRVCLIGPSGSGKSTAAFELAKRFKTIGKSVELLKLAEPLYRIQSIFYEEANIGLGYGSQNQQLLELIAAELRHLSADSIIQNFNRRLHNVFADVVINDDLRDRQVDWPAMVASGFIVVRILTDGDIRVERLSRRKDLNIVEHSALDENFDFISYQYLLTNNGSLDDFFRQLEGLVTAILGE